MAGDYEFGLASQHDDAEIRQLLANNPVPGRVALTYLREPNYFLGCSVMGSTEVLIARHQPSGQLAAVATRSTRQLFVNGSEESVGYIGQLRVDSAHRGRWIVPQGFRLFHNLHQDGRARGYITTIIEGNREAKGILVTKARRHLPAYRELDSLCTLAIVVHRRHLRAAYCAPGIALTTGTQGDLPETIEFLRKVGRHRQCFPAYTAADFDSGAMRGFRIGDMQIARRGSAIVGLLGLWDQSSFKQTLVHGVGRGLNILRPLYNAGALIAGAQPLAAKGEQLRTVYASFLAITQDDPAILRTLLDAASRKAADRGYTYLTLGLSMRDPLFPIARRYCHIPYVSNVYTVCWQGDEIFHEKLDGRPLRLELATL